MKKKYIRYWWVIALIGFLLFAPIIPVIKYKGDIINETCGAPPPYVEKKNLYLIFTVS